MDNAVLMKKEKGIAGFATSKLEDHVDIRILNVLIRLPAKSLMRFKTVCKSWYALISDPSFAESHHIHAQTKPDASFIVFYFLTRYLRSRAIFATNFDGICSDKLPIHHFKSLMPCTNIVNGLICLWDDIDKNSLFVLNVTTGEHLALPRGITNFPKGKGISSPGPDEIIECKSSYFLGFDPIGKKYKLLNLQNIKRKDDVDYVPDKCYILTLGSESWRRIYWPKFLHSDRETETQSLNGAIYWKDPTVMPYFDVAKEVFSCLICPNDVQSIDLLTQVEGHLAFLCQDRILWKLEDISSHRWSEEEKIPLPRRFGLPLNLNPIGTTNTDEIMIMTSSNREPKMPKTLMFYDLITKKYRTTEINVPADLLVKSSSSTRNSLPVFADAAVSNHVENIFPLNALSGRKVEQNFWKRVKSITLKEFASTMV